MLLRISSLLLALFLCTCVSAQNLPDKAKNRAADRAERKANNKVDQKVDQAVDETFKAIEGLFKKKKKKNKNGEPAANQTATQRTGTAPQKGDADYEQTVDDGGLVPNDGNEYADDEEVGNALSNLFGGGGDFEPYTNDVAFSMDMHVKSIKRNGKTEESTISMAVGRTQVAQKVNFEDKGEKGNSWSIFDTQTGKVTLITTSKGETTGMRMKSPNLRNLIKPDAAQDYLDGITYENTGETRIIEGYNTTKYVMTDTREGTVTESWITTDIEIDPTAMASAMSAFIGGQTLTPGENAPVEGFPIFTTSTDKKGNRYEMTYKNVKVGEGNINTQLFDTGNIQIQDIPGF
ncbi:hypothetical protein [Lewinella sp. 4G2]|uniref:hypothetical protein n=1 Tax=Lewinella sp. 4G2 TaxID=1803372 RepID=UPI0007B4A6FC|nr:hypothetical protein [Lewinella sp. 4G2]OAV43087.1 hypothetical protein A3850_000595 [Lewinella sp. 4G2]